MVNIKVEDGYDYHTFGSNNNDDEAELAVYSLPPLALGDLDENGDFVIPLSCKSNSSISDNNNKVATSPRRTTPVRKCRSRQFTTVSPATTMSTSHSDNSVQDSFDDYQDKNYDNDNDFWTPTKQSSPRNKTKTTNRKASTRQHRRKSRSKATAIASAAQIEKELGYSVQVGKDVLCGRGQKIKVFNEHYREMIRENYPSYVATKCDITKREIAKRIWSHIVEDRGGRFLDIYGVELNKAMAVLKVMKALKDAKKQLDKPISHSTQKIRAKVQTIRAATPVLNLSSISHSTQKIRATVQTIRAATPVLNLSSKHHIHLRKNLVTPPVETKPIKKMLSLCHKKLVTPPVQTKPIKKNTDYLALVEPISLDDPGLPIEGDDSFLETLDWLASMEYSI